MATSGSTRLRCGRLEIADNVQQNAQNARPTSLMDLLLPPAVPKRKFLRNDVHPTQMEKWGLGASLLQEWYLRQGQTTLPPGATEALQRQKRVSPKWTNILALAAGRQIIAWTFPPGLGQNLVKASPAFGQRRLLKKHGLYCFCPSSFLTFGQFNCRSPREGGGGSRCQIRSFFRGGAGVRI